MNFNIHVDWLVSSGRNSVSIFIEELKGEKSKRTTSGAIGNGIRIHQVDRSNRGLDNSHARCDRVESGRRDVVGMDFKSETVRASIKVGPADVDAVEAHLKDAILHVQPVVGVPC